MTSQRTFLIYGFSHTAALVGALTEDERPQFEIVNPNLHKHKLRPGSKIPALRRLLIPNPDLLCIANANNAHNVLCVLEHQLPFGIVGHVNDDPDRTRRYYVPMSLIRAVLAARFTDFAGPIDTLIRLFPDSKLVVVAPPPPIANKAFIRTTQSGAMFKNTLTRDVPNPDLRRTVYEEDRTLYRRKAEKIGAIFLDVPPGTRDADGLLLDKYARGDPPHANEAYGRLVIDRLLEI